MTELVPDNRNRLAYILGLILHPAVVMLPTLWLILKDITFETALLWISIIAAIILIPGFSMIAFLKRREQYTYQREARLPIYLVAWFSVLVSIGIIRFFDGPEILLVCMATLAVWLPLQLLINHFITKISTHVAVIAGCYTALMILGKINHPVWIIVGLLLIGLTAWARVMTKNHSLLQVSLGLFTGVGTVLLIFPLLLA